MPSLEDRVAALEALVRVLMRPKGAPFAVARSTLAPIDTGKVQTIQGQLDPISSRDGMPVLMHYGFSSAMPVGSDKLVAFVDMDRSKAVVIASGHQTYRLTGLLEGEVALSDNRGRSIKLAQGGIVINANGGPVTIENCTTFAVDANLIALNGQVTQTQGSADVGTVTLVGPVNVTGDVIAGAGSSNISLINHVQTNGGGSGNSGPPATGT